MAAQVRLQKFLADAGVCSRRKAETLITSGQVAVDGSVVTELGTKVDPDSKGVAVNGKPISRPDTEGIVIVLNKPRGYITSTSSRQGKTVYDLIPEHTPRLLPVGRLDKDSEGVLLMTNRNELISELTHPRNQHEKKYRVTVSGPVTPETLSTLNRPITLEGTKMSARVRKLRPTGMGVRTVLEFTLTEGKNRQIRRMCEATGLKVHRLLRTQFAGLGLKGLKSGECRRVTEKYLPSAHH